MIRGETGQHPPRHAQEDEPSPEPAADRPFTPPVRPPLAEALSQTPAPPPSPVQPAPASLPAEPSPPPAPALPSGDAWARVLRAQGMPTVLRTVLTNLSPVSVDLAAGRVVLSGAARYADSARTRHGQIVDFCRRELGQTIEIIIQSDDAPPDESVASSNEPAHDPAAPVSDATNQADDQSAAPPPPAPASPRPAPMVPSQHPLVKEAMELFGARIVDIQNRRPSA